MEPSVMLRRVVIVRTDVSEELGFSIIRVTRTNPIHTTPFYLSKMSLNIIYPSTFCSSQPTLSLFLSHRSSI
jgi:hypothetical protein